MQGLPSVDGLVRIVIVIGLLAASADVAAQEPAPGVVVITVAASQIQRNEGEGFH